MIRIQILSVHNDTICENTKLQKVYDNKPFVRSTLVSYKSHGTSLISNSSQESTYVFTRNINITTTRLAFILVRFHTHPKTLIEIAMVLSTNSGSFPSNSHVSATFPILLRFGESWNPTNCEKFNADGSQMGRTNLDQSVW